MIRGIGPFISGVGPNTLPIEESHRRARVYRCATAIYTDS